MRLVIVKNREVGISETFIRAHVERLPATTCLVHGLPPRREGLAVPALPLLDRAETKLRRLLGRNRPSHTRWTACYLRLFSEFKPTAVLAEYGPTGVLVRPACARLGLPLIVHFHGYDASDRSVIEEYRDEYRILFREAQALVAVSEPMRRALIELGADPAKVHYNPCGVEVERFDPGNPAETDCIFLAVGRLVEKKAPHLLLLAFARVVSQQPEARLRVVGDGPLLGICKDLVRALEIEHAVEFLGALPHGAVLQEMRRARAFVQHSVVADSGDSEGTPVAVMEAGAAALPVVATRHAGIPAVVVENQTGLLVNERDVVAMGDAMLRLARRPDLAREMGLEARSRVSAHFGLSGSIEHLWSIIEEATQVR